jgi:hypothetical protein
MCVEAVWVAWLEVDSRTSDAALADGALDQVEVPV